MNNIPDDRRKRDYSRAKFARRSDDRPVDFGDLPTVPMDLYPQDPKLPVPETREFEVDSWAEVVDAVAAVEQKGWGA